MAQKSFLSSEQWAEAAQVLTPPLTTPDGDVRQVYCFSSESFSSWLGLQLEEKLKSLPDWEKAHPVILGSWARGELSPKSDIDILFCGDEDAVKNCIEPLLESGLKLRYRMPQNPEDWTENVEAFDILALLKARPWTSEAARKLHAQQKKIWATKKVLRREILKSLKAERRDRTLRFDSIANYLEPNIKYGPGGLRDLEQGLQIYELFAEKFTHPGHALNVFKYYRSYFLNLRQKLQIEGHGDILSSSFQFDLGRWVGFKDNKDFMRSLQRGLSRVHFYSDWMFEVATHTEEHLKKVENLSFKKIEDLVLALKKDSSVLMQKKVRETMDSLLPQEKIKTMGKRRGVLLEDILDVKGSEDFLVSVFRSRLMDKLVPEMNRLVGYVQHDQYHRFTADSHILQACREVRRIYKKSSFLGPLKSLHKKMKGEDWKILAWTALYHDLAKGLDAGEEHADLGVQIVERDFKAYGFKKNFTEEVKWMVKNHLELSHAAFRKNPKDPRVWQELKDKGIVGRRLERLALFTVIDIRATNPEAWNDWKGKLLKDLLESLESKKAQDYFSFQKMSLQLKLRLPSEAIEEFGPFLLESVPVKELVQDLKKAESSEVSLKPKLYSSKKGGLWIRFHQRRDRPGLLSDYVGQLHSLGLSIRHASVQTLPRVGVYDWFQVSSTKNIEQIKKILENAQVVSKAIPEVQFAAIQIVSVGEKEWALSFKAADQSGLLASATKSLHDLGVSIRSAKVHTWGRQVDDIIFVKPLEGASPEDLLALLKKRYQLN